LNRNRSQRPRTLTVGQDARPRPHRAGCLANRRGGSPAIVPRDHRDFEVRSACQRLDCFGPSSLESDLDCNQPLQAAVDRGIQWALAARRDPGRRQEARHIKTELRHEIDSAPTATVMTCALPTRRSWCGIEALDRCQAAINCWRAVTNPHAQIGCSSGSRRAPQQERALRLYSKPSAGTRCQLGASFLSTCRSCERDNAHIPVRSARLQSFTLRKSTADSAARPVPTIIEGRRGQPWRMGRLNKKPQPR